MKKLLIILFVIGMAVQSFGQPYYVWSGGGGAYTQLKDDGVAPDASIDGVYTTSVVITTATGSGGLRWAVQESGSNVWPTSGTSWYVTTTDGQVVIFSYDTNTYSDGWFPTNNIGHSSDQLASGSTIELYFDNVSQGVMVDDGTTNGDWAVDNIFSYKISGVVSGSHTWYVQHSSASASKFGQEGRVQWATAFSLSLTGDVYFYLDLNKDRLTASNVANLPVELTSFTATSIGSATILLNWETATEVNNYGFDVQSSNDDSNWNTIGFVEGHGNSNSPKIYSFIVPASVAERSRSYRLKQLDTDGAFEYSDVVEVETNLSYKLSQNHPNPFNPSTVIRYEIGDTRYVSLKIFNTLGQEVATLINKEQNAGKYQIDFNASSLSSGMYFYKLETSDFSKTMKMMLVK